MDTTSWIFDNAGSTSLEEIAAQIKAAGGKIDGDLRKLEKGGVVANIDSKTATAAMSKIADWCAAVKIRATRDGINSHQEPANRLRSGSHRRNISRRGSGDPGTLHVQEQTRRVHRHGQSNSEGKQHGEGVDGERERRDRRGEGLVERQRTSMTCFGCNNIGHRILECKEAKRCKQCGQTDHMKATCTVNKEELATKCN